MAYRNLEVEIGGRVATLTVSRPEVRNALDGETVAELHRALEEARAARAAVLIVTGKGDQAFVSGADIAAIRERRRDDALASINSRLMAAVEAHEAVTIAAVNGYVLGGGCELALARAICGWRRRTPCSASRSRASGSSRARAAPSGSRVSWAWAGRRR